MLQLTNITCCKKDIYNKKNTLLDMEMSSKKKKKKEDWIQKDLKNKIPKLDKKTVYVPFQNELPF